MVIYFIYFYFTIVLFSKTITNELSEKVLDDEEKYLVFNFTRLVRTTFTAVAMLITGVLVQKSKNNNMKDYKIFYMFS